VTGPPSPASTLERSLGDPWDAANPVGFAAVLDADELGEPLAAGEHLLDDAGLNAEFVPASLGGRLTTLDRLIQIGRSVFRRDPSLGLSYGMSSFIAAVNVWTSGRDEQQRELADLLLANQKVAIAFHELAHGNDFTRNDFRARPDGAGRLLLTGRKELIANVERASALVILARTADARSGPAQSQLLVPRDGLDPARTRFLPRFSTVGMRGVPLGGVELTDCPVPEDAFVGVPGRAPAVAMRAFQVTRTVLPAMAAGSLDTALRTVLTFAGSRVLRGAPAAEMPYVRQILAEVFLDLLICDCVSTTAAHAIHLLPAETSVHAAAVKYFVPTRLSRAMHRLSQVLGAQFYLRDGRYGILQKLVRDLPPAVFGHAAPEVCLATILPQLPRVARSWSDPAPPPDGLFTLGADLPPIEFGRLLPTSTSDTVGAAMLATEVPAGDGPPPWLAEVFVAELRELRREILALPVSDLSLRASATALTLPRRYTTVLAAVSCLNVWLRNRASGQGFLADPAWVTAALSRLAGELGQGPSQVAGPLAEALYAELLDRRDTNVSFDLYATPLGL